MSQQSGFFNAKVLEDGSYDRVYLAKDFANYFASFVGNGVFAKKLNGLQVLADSGMTLKVRSGQAWINGYWYENDSDLSLSLSTAPAAGYRIDSVVLRYWGTSRAISCFVKPGGLNVNDPAPLREGDTYELVLAYVKVSAGSISISQSNIVDKRGDNSVCGFVTGVIDQIDTTEFYTQLNNWLEEYNSKVDKDYETFTAYLNSKKSSADSNLTVFQGDLDTLKNTATTEVNGLIEEIRGLLDGDVATNLQNQIDKKLNIPTREVMTNHEDFIPTIGHKSDGSIDTASVEFISALNFKAGKILPKGKNGEGLSSIQSIDVRSIFDDVKPDTNPYEYDKSNGTLNRSSQYLVPGTQYGGPDCMVDAATWSKMKEAQENQLKYMYAMSLMSLEGIPFEGLNPPGQGKTFSFPLIDGTENLYFDYNFEILLFRNLPKVSDLFKGTASTSLYDVGVISLISGGTSDIERVPSLFGNLHLTFEITRGVSSSKSRQVIIYIDNIPENPINESEYKVLIRKFSLNSPYSSGSQSANWISGLE